MADQDMDGEVELAAGSFSPWLTGLKRALRGEAGSDVPCGSCTACRTSSQFVHIEPDEHETLTRIPGELLFPAPGLPEGHVVMGYDDRGYCPMLVDAKCSIYDDRPRTCRTYDCRVVAAAGVDLELDDKPLIARRVRRWRFTFETEVDRTRYAAVRAAAGCLREHQGRFPAGVVPSNPTQLAVLAAEIHDLFLHVDVETGQTAVVVPPWELVESELLRRRRPQGVS